MSVIILRPISDVATQLLPNSDNYSYVDEETPDNDTTIVYYSRTDTSPEESKSDQYDVETTDITEGIVNSFKVKAVVSTELVYGKVTTANTWVYLGVAFTDGVVWGNSHKIGRDDGWVTISDTFTHTANGSPITWDEIKVCNVLISLYPDASESSSSPTEPVPPPGGGGVPS